METKTLLSQFHEDYKTAYLIVDREFGSGFNFDLFKKYSKRTHFISEMLKLNHSDILTAFQTARIYVLNSEQLATTQHYLEFTRILKTSPNIQETRENFYEHVWPYQVDSLKLPARSIYLVLEPQDEDAARSLLITKDFVIGFFNIPNIEVNDTYIPHLLYYKDEWLVNDDYWFIGAAMSIKMSMELINSQTTIRYNGLNDKTFIRSQTKIFKKAKFKPREYYRVELKQTVIKEDSEAREATVKSECNYAYDVRGHFCYRILTGDLPMDTKTEKYLKRDPRRKIFLSESELDEETNVELNKRGISMKDGQWLSVLKYWIEPHIANSKDGKNKYIPSIKTIT